MQSALRRRARALTASVVMVMAAAVAPSTAGAAEQPNPRAERERIRSEQATVASELDALKASSDEVTQALGDLDANVSDQQALLGDARRTAELAAEQLAQAQTQERQGEGEITELEGLVREVAVEEFMRPTTADPTMVLTSDSIADASRRSALLDFRAQRDDAMLDELRAAREDLALSRQQAERAAVQAEQERTEVAGRVEKLEQARDQQADFAVSVEQRLDATLAEAASLASLDAEVAEQIRADEARLAAQLRASRPAPRPAPDASRPSAGGGGDGASPARGSEGGGGRTSGGGASAASGEAGAPRGGGASSRPAPSITGNGSIVSVRGIRVSTQIAQPLSDMLGAADADGMNFAGGGFRDPAAQVSLRQSNCGSSEYAMYSMPASQCSPPTARPGSSMHEQGLAVDFTYNGSLISSRSNPGFQWLAANAARFGFFNLPSEPWHWSITGN